MAKTFSSLKTKVNLYDFLTFGKFKGCRVDSLLADEYEYLQYLKYNKIVTFDTSVLEALEDRLRGAGLDAEDNPYYDDPKMDYSDWTEDVPF